MKNILLTTTALVMTAGVASADVNVGGSAIAGLVYNSETDQSVKLLSKVNINFSASGETDAGLSFGFDTNHIVSNNGSVDNDDTTVYVSGAFGKLSFGAVGEADEVAGLSDIGWDGLDVDDVAEALVGDEIGDFLGGGMGHDVNYSYSAGPISVALSTQLGTENTKSTLDTYAAGVRYSFANGYVGLGYGDHKKAGLGSAKVVSLYGGVTMDAFKVSALYADAGVKDAGGTKYSAKSYGVNASYKMDAMTVSMGASRADFDVALGVPDQTAFGIGAAYDLGGGASVSGGIARVKSVLDENVGSGKETETRADLGVKFSF